MPWQALKCKSSLKSRVRIVEYTPLLPWGSLAVLMYRLSHSPWYPPSAVGQFDSANVPTAAQSLMWAIVRISSEQESSQHRGATTPLG